MSFFDFLRIGLDALLGGFLDDDFLHDEILGHFRKEAVQHLRRDGLPHLRDAFDLEGQNGLELFAGDELVVAVFGQIFRNGFQKSFDVNTYGFRGGWRGRSGGWLVLRHDRGGGD